MSDRGATIKSALVKAGVDEKSISSNGYWYHFEYRGYGITLCDQGSRLVGSVHASPASLHADENGSQEIGYLFASGGGLDEQINIALQQAAVGGTQEECSASTEEDDHYEGYRDHVPAPQREGVDWYGRTPFEAEQYAHGQSESGRPRWMEPFAKYDLFGKPTVFHPDFGRRR